MNKTNNKLDFLREGELGILFGRPGIGKTAMAFNIILNAANSGTHCFYYSLEQTGQELSMGIIGAYGGIARSKLSGLNMEERSLLQLGATINDLSKLPIYLEGNPEFNLGFMINDLKQREIPPGSLIVVDYLQLATTASDSEIVGTLNDYAVSCGLKVLVLSQHQKIATDEQPSLQTCVASTSKEVISFAHRVGIVLRDSFDQSETEEEQPMKLELFKPEKETIECMFHISSGRID